VQAAFTDCGKSNGSGTIVLPSGHTFLTTGVQVSNFNALVLSVQGTWLFSDNAKTCDQKYQSCVSFEDGMSLAITGGGLVDGNGYEWWATAGKTGFRPGLVKTESVAVVLITGLTFIDRPNHNLELFSVRQEVWLVNITAWPPCQDPPNSNKTFCAHNTDAVDTHNSDAACIHDCMFSVGDDNVAIHCNNTLVEGCTFGYGHGASIGSLGQGT
jgi:polygalacturonase